MIVVPTIPSSAAEFLPPRRTLSALATAAGGCRGCALYRDATQVVFGSGPGTARLVLVGEMPGDAEDRAGRPFVGPAGTLLDQALAEAGIDRLQVYITNAVKHFRFLAGAGRRLHKTPGPTHITACRPWLDAQLRAVTPQVTVCLGAVALRAVLGRPATIRSRRGRPFMHATAGQVVATIHPSWLLRMPHGAQRDREWRLLCADLAGARALLSGRPSR